MSPFDQIEDSPVWDHFCKVMHDDRINLTDLWRTAGRPRHKSPRRWARMYHYLEDIEFTGKSADAPAMSDLYTAMNYIQRLDFKILDAVYTAFRERVVANPAKVLLECPDDGFGTTITASFASMFIAECGDRTSADKRITAQAVELTNDLGVYAQETAVAKVQRALIEAKKITTGRMIDGEFVVDR
jgi:hypothetical protein